MNMIRVIPTLLLQGRGLVKTQNFKKPFYVGDPINAVRIFNEKEVDELVILDINISKENLEPRYDWIRDIVSESFMPIGYGGGIKNITQAKRLFDLGIEKIILNSASEDFTFIEQLANTYGSQSIAACIDAKKNIFGGYRAYKLNGAVKVKLEPDKFAQQLVNAGIGEIIIQSIDKEGSMKGYDIDLIKMISDAVSVPVVASGGAATINDLKDAVKHGGASAVTAGSMFVFKGKHRAVLINYPQQSELKELFCSI